MQAPVIVMNDASSRQTGPKAQVSNITGAKVKNHNRGSRTILVCSRKSTRCHTYLSGPKGDVEDAS